MLLVSYIPRVVSFLIAKASYERRFIGTFAKALHSIPVIRPQDVSKGGTGTIYLKDPHKSPHHLQGCNTKFQTEIEPKAVISLPNNLGSAEVLEIISDTELILLKPFQKSCWDALVPFVKAVEEHGTSSSASPTPTIIIGSKFKIIPHIDQNELFQNVEAVLLRNEDGSGGGCVGIFPEGGSHDRTELLPLKAGAVVMALSTMAGNPGVSVRIVPVGLSYFNPHRFRSRAVVEFGEVLEINPESVELFKVGGSRRRDAVSQLLGQITTSLKSLTVDCPDYRTLKIVRAARRLYVPPHMKVNPLFLLDLTRRFVKGFLKFKDTPRIKQLATKIEDYNTMLMNYGIRDHQVDNTAIDTFTAVGLLALRLFQLVVVCVLVLPGLVLNSPVIALCEYISVQKAKDALAHSSVKIRGFDVISTWKILVAAVLLPLLHIFIAVLFYLSLPSTSYSQPVRIILSIILLMTSPTASYLTVRLCEIAMDIAVSVRPIAVSLVVRRRDVHGLREFRRGLQRELREVVELFGPEVVPDFHRTRLVKVEDFGVDGVGESGGSSSGVNPDQSFSERDTGLPGLGPMGGTAGIVTNASESGWREESSASSSEEEEGHRSHHVRVEHQDVWERAFAHLLGAAGWGSRPKPMTEDDFEIVDKERM
ncbi:hypothetical protein HDU76_001662 [Blyttiomyces sp. JEL0837]|nr:hypothetical protein HDU76_001662 [Blyttiomyces sp. JEL0837]